MKIIAYSTAALLALSGAALAEGHSARDLAGAMSDRLSSGAATLGGDVNPGKTNKGKGTASDVSGGGKGGWGNEGSAAFDGQVSNRNGLRGDKR